MAYFIYFISYQLFITFKKQTFVSNMQIQLQEYNKIAQLHNLSSPQVLSQINITDRFDYAKDVSSFNAFNKGKPSQIYITNIAPRKQIQKTVHLKDCPKILYLKGDPESLIIQQGINQRLNELLIYYQSLPYYAPYLEEDAARKIIWELTLSANDYQHNGLNYDCISLKNAVVRKNQRWELSVVGYILQVDKNNSQYYSKNITDTSQRSTFALGCLFFKLLFGFSPIIVGAKQWNKFDFNSYLNILQAGVSQKLLKIYHFCERILEISPDCKKLLQQALSGQVKWNQWLNHPYFQQQLQPPVKLQSKKKQILMIKQAQPRYASLIMSAIDYRKKHQLEKLNSKPQFLLNQLSISQLSQRYNWFNYIQASDRLSYSREKVSQHQEIKKTVFEMNYFNQQFFDCQSDYPIRDLINFIQSQKQKHPEKFANQKYQNMVKLYGYPYAVAFQLLKIQPEQSPQIRKKIKIAFDLLMQISALNEFDPKLRLHKAELTCKNFEQIKPLYRQTINDLYQFCLNQAMRKYNVKNEVQARKQEKKRQGLQYYRLCLILLQASLIVRKGGSGLNLVRIQTASKKQIEQDLNSLLQKYFPKKPELH